MAATILLEALSMGIPTNALAGPSDLSALPSYEQISAKKQQAVKSNLPSSREAEALASFDKDMFTEDGWEGMLGVMEYSRFIEGREVQDRETACGEPCTAARDMLEKAYQVVSNDFYSPRNDFSQAKWAASLLKSLKEAGGTLESKRDLYKALGSMMDSLGDPYTKFLPPAEFRRAILRPNPAERAYHDVQMVGPGLIITTPGKGGWLVDAPVPESPAEAAGIRRGDLLVAVDGFPVDPSRVPLSAARAMLRGPLGTSTVLTIRPAAPAPTTPTPTPTSTSTSTSSPVPYVPRPLTYTSASFPLNLPSIPLPQLPSLPLSAPAPAPAPSPPGPLKEIEVDRVFLNQPPLRASTIALDDGRWVRYIRLHFFTCEGSAELKRALEWGERDGVAGFILDLRNNPGGVFEEALYDAALFVGERPPEQVAAAELAAASASAALSSYQAEGEFGFVLDAGSGSGSDSGLAAARLMEASQASLGQPVVLTRLFRNMQERSEPWTTETLAAVFDSTPYRITDRPVVILTNAASASSSEILTGALKDYGRAVVVGEKTFGKGQIQYYYPLADGSGLKVSVAKYLTPAGHDVSLQGGVLPHIPCSDHPRSSVPTTPSYIEDKCVLQAVQVISEEAGQEGGGAGTDTATRGPTA